MKLAQKAVTGWKTDRPRSSAHTGILGKLVKRECMKRHGCLSRRTYDSTEGLLRNWMENNASYYQVLRVTLNDDDGVIGVDDDRVMRTAPLGVVSGAVVGVVTGCPSG